MSKLEIAKKIIKENFENAECGLYDTRNIVGDPMTTIYSDDDITIDICYRYAYFEVFGLSPDEFEELEKFYASLR